MNHHAIIVLGQQQVAAATNDEQRFALTFQQADHFGGLACRSIFHEGLATGINTECIVGQQTIVMQDIHHSVSFVSFHLSC